MKLELLHDKAKGDTKGTPVLFVHGMWHGAWCWQEYFMPYFAGKGYDVYALSLRGHAGSEGHEKLRWSSIADYVKDVEWAVAQIGKSPVIVGHSMGGFITQKYLETHQSPAAVLLTTGPYFGLWPSTWMVFRRHPLTVMRVILTMHLYPIVETTELAKEALFSKDIPGDVLEKYHKRLGNESFRAYLDQLGLNLVRPSRVRTPMLVIAAGDDAVIPLKTVQKTAHAFGTEAVVLSGIAHDAMLETKWQTAADHMLTWLAEKGL